MRIQVIDKEHRIDLPIPTGLILNRFTAGIAAKAAAEHGAPVTPAQMRRMIATLKACKKTRPDWVLVEVESADGEYVKIKL